MTMMGTMIHKPAEMNIAPGTADSNSRETMVKNDVPTAGAPKSTSDLNTKTLPISLSFNNRVSKSCDAELAHPFSAPIT